MQETWVRSLGWEDPWRRKWQDMPVFLLGNPMDRGAWWPTVHGVARVRHNLATKAPPPRLTDFQLIKLRSCTLTSSWMECLKKRFSVGVCEGNWTRLHMFSCFGGRICGNSKGWWFSQQFFFQHPPLPWICSVFLYLLWFVGQARFNSNEVIFIFTLSLWIAPIDNSLRLSLHFLFLYSDMEMFYASQRVRKAPGY